jgi:hypothetical protein
MHATRFTQHRPFVVRRLSCDVPGSTCDVRGSKFESEGRTARRTSNRTTHDARRTSNRTTHDARRTSNRTTHDEPRTTNGHPPASSNARSTITLAASGFANVRAAAAIRCRR